MREWNLYHYQSFLIKEGKWKKFFQKKNWFFNFLPLQTIRNSNDATVFTIPYSGNFAKRYN